MNQQNNNRPVGLPEEWLTHARSNLKLAKIGNDQEVLPEQICFHNTFQLINPLKNIILTMISKNIENFAPNTPAIVYIYNANSMKLV